MTSTLIPIFALLAVVWHVTYQVMLKRLDVWGVPVDRKSWGMGSNKNIPAYYRELRRQGHSLDGPLATLLVTTLLGIVCVSVWLYLNVFASISWT